MIYLLDTNVVSELARSTPNPNIVARIAREQPNLAISAVTRHEILYGVERLQDGARKEKYRAFFTQITRTFPTVSYGKAAADWHAKERARLTKAGQTVDVYDLQIAATAITHGLVLVTLNRKHFVGLADLKVEDWS